MQSVSEHHFRDGQLRLSARISEVMREEYGLYVWPASIPLAEYVWQQRDRFRGIKALELGAGTALPGIVAAKVGAQVTLTDHADQPQVFDNMRRTCELNGVDCKMQGLTWGEWDEETCALQHGGVQIILGADVLYQSDDFDDLLATVSYLLHGTPNAVFITTYQHRSGHRSLEYLMAKWGLCCTRLMDVADFMPAAKISSLPATLQLAEIVLRQNMAPPLVDTGPSL